MPAEKGRDKHKQVADALGANRSRITSLGRTQSRGVLPEHEISPGAGGRFVPSGNEILETFASTVITETAVLLLRISRRILLISITVR